MNSQTFQDDDITRMASEIMHHKRCYYKGQPEISDAQYDQLESKLAALSPNHPALSFVGTDEPTSARKVHHDRPMLSLQKTYQIDELLNWANDHDIMASLKVDGVSMSLVYEGGQLSLAKTRGNGKTGEDVTNKIRWVNDCINQIDETLDLEIRGELYCSEHHFAGLVEEMISLGLERPSNPRNIVAGLLGRKSFIDLCRYFNFFAFDVLSDDSSLEFSTEFEKFNWLKKTGFRLPHPRLIKTKDELNSYIQGVQNFMEEGEIGIDGAVFSYNDIELHQQLGHTAHHPRYKISYKWQGETAESQIRDIIWSTSRLGIVTPVAIIEPVRLSGAQITNVTLHNAEHVKAYNLKPGDKIEIVRSGEVIPKFLQVIKATDGSYLWPSNCNSCGEALSFDGVRLKCPNKTACSAQQIGSILNWIKCTKIDDLSEKRLELLMERKLVKTIPDLYRLEIDDFMELPKVKEKLAKKLHNNIQESRKLSLVDFLNGLGIAGLGLTSWEKILSKLPSLENVQNANVEDIITIDGFAEKTAQQIVDGIKQNKPLIDELLELGIKPYHVNILQDASSDHELSGKSIAITGTLSRPRSELETIIKTVGGHPTSSVSKNTYALVSNNPNSSSSKTKKAKQLEVPIWSEEELLSRINSQ